MNVDWKVQEKSALEEDLSWATSEEWDTDHDEKEAVLSKE